MKKPDPIHDLKEPMHCPACDFVIVCVGDVQNPQPIKKGNIIVCSGCGNVLEVGDSDLKKLSPETIESLDPQSKALIHMLVTKQLADNMKAGNN